MENLISHRTPGATRRHVNKAEASRFVVQNRRELIQKVILISPILDQLLEEKVITKEGYDKVRSKATPQEMMRELYALLNSNKSKYIFYKGLETHENGLLEDLYTSPPLQLKEEAAASVSVVTFDQHGATGAGPSSSKSTRGGVSEDEDFKISGHPITYWEGMLQAAMEKTYRCVKLDNEPKMKLDDVYVPLYNININSFTNMLNNHEVRMMEMNKAIMGKPIELGEIFKDPSGINDERTVLTVGVAGIGKTFLVNKFIHDWTQKCFPQDPHLLFPLTFRQLNLLEGEIFSLAELIHECIEATNFIKKKALNEIFTQLQKSNDYNKSPVKVIFVLDGIDENRLQFDFEKKYSFIEVDETFPVEVLLANLITGKLLPSAHIWMTSRPAAAGLIPEGIVDKMTEVRGFTDGQKMEYFRKRFMKIFSDDRDEASSMASLIISHIKKSKTLSAMCEIPVFCWIISFAVQHKAKTDKLPETLVDIYSQFLTAQTKQKKKKYGASGETKQKKKKKKKYGASCVTKQKNKTYHASNEKNKEKLIKAEGKVILKLGRLAFDQLVKQNIMFYREDVEACGLDVDKDLLNSGMCAAFFKEDRAYFHKKVYCFVHLSIQEFLAAVYLYHCFTQRNKRQRTHLFTKRNMKVLKAFLKDEEHNSSDNFGSLSDFLKATMRKALKSESGHLGLFVRFLHGLALERSNESLLGGLLDQTENCPQEIQRIISNLKEMNDEDISPDRCINIFQCLMEMKDSSLSQGIQQYLESENMEQGKKLSETQCSALASMLQMSEEVLDELDVEKYNTSKEGRQRLVPAVKNVRKARLVDCDLGDTHYEVVASALSSDPSPLKQLDLSYNNLGQEDSLERLCAGLKSSHCCLEILRLTHCWLTERCCEVLASAVTSNPTLHLKELDLRFNVLNDSALQLFSGQKTLLVKHGGEDWIKPHLLTRYFYLLTLDANTAHRSLSLSEDNRKVTRVKQRHSYPDHPDRFEGQVQVLCTEGLTGRCYWEVERSGEVKIGVTCRGIGRKGQDEDCMLGYQDMSWILACSDGDLGNSYSVRHNSKVTYLPLCPSDSNRVALYLDYPAGTLSFYEVSSDTLTHLYTFQDTFTEPLYAGFYLRSDTSVCLCEQR